MPTRCPPSSSLSSASFSRARGFPHSAPATPAAHPGSGLAFFLFILVNVVLFIRPAEIYPELLNLPIYEVVILICLAASLPWLADFFRRNSLRDQPITVCVLGMLPAILLSHVSHLNFYGVRTTGFDFFKVEIYYLLLLANVTSVTRLRQFMTCLVALISIVSVLSILQYHGFINMAAIRVRPHREILEEEEFLVQRLQGTGIFNDPNDFCLILVIGMIICAYRLTDRQLGLLRIVPLCLLGLMAHALTLTHSRGGFIAFVTALFVLVFFRFGWKKTLILSALALPLLLFVFGGRQTRFNFGDPEDTGRARFEYWSECLLLFKQSPVFGIGMNSLADEINHVAHNSFVHSFTELGLFGGMLFLGVMVSSIVILHRLGSPGIQICDSELRRLRPYLLAMSMGIVAGLFSLSRAYVLTTYLAPGIITTFVAMAPLSPPKPVLRFDLRLVQWLLILSIVFMVAVYVFIRFVVH